MQVYRPSLNKISQLSINNPRYFALCVSRSQYSESEIVSALVEIEQVNSEWQALQNHIYTNILVDKNGEMSVLTGFATPTHQEISSMIYKTDYISPHMSENSHRNCFPVAKWNKEIVYLRKQMSKIQKLIERTMNDR